MKVDFSLPDIREEDIQEVVETLRSGWITTGPRTKQFEKEIARMCGTEYAVCLASATASMEMTLRIMGIGPGDEVITTAYTYTASCSVICHVGATPVLVDTLPGSFEMDPAQVERAVTEKTKAIICVDLAGIVYSRYDEIYRIAEEKRPMFRPANERQEALGRILVMADGAHAFGASRDGKRLYREYMLLSLHGQSKDALAKTRAGAWEYDIVAPFYKCNMTDIQAALGLSQLRRYESIFDRRREMIRRYDEAWTEDEVQVLSHYGDTWRSSGHLYLTRLNGKNREECSRIIDEMAEHDVAANVHYKPLPMMTAYRNLGFDIADYPNAYAQYENEITLPLHTCMTDDQQEYVIEVFRRFAGL